MGEDDYRDLVNLIIIIEGRKCSLEFGLYKGEEVLR